MCNITFLDHKGFCCFRVSFFIQWPSPCRIQGKMSGFPGAFMFSQNLTNNLWNDFQENVNTAFWSLREDKECLLSKLAIAYAHRISWNSGRTHPRNQSFQRPFGCFLFEEEDNSSLSPHCSPACNTYFEWWLCPPHATFSFGAISAILSLSGLDIFIFGGEGVLTRLSWERILAFEDM